MKARPLVLAVALPTTVQASPAFALEPLGAFLASAKDNNLDNLEARANADQRGAETDAAWFKLLPTLTATGQYTHNQYPGIAYVGTGTQAVKEVTISAENQLDATIAASVTLIDVGNWERIGVANRNREATKLRGAATALDVQKSVARSYYQLVGAEAVVEAAKRSLDAEEATLKFVTTRQGAGFASELEVKRAVAEVERNKQNLAEGQYQVALARRALETATGLHPGAGGPELDASLEREAPLESWLPSVDGLPAVRAAETETRAAERTATATRMALAPSIAATAQERFTNAPGFGQQPYYQLLATATWKIDGTVLANAAAQDAQAAAAKVRETRSRWVARDAIHDAWHEIDSLLEKCRAAREQVAASSLAARLAKQKYQAGTATFLDVTTAERDAFQAEVQRIEADASLLNARASLRIAAGRSIEEGAAK